jgi:peroxiredoxin
MATIAAQVDELKAGMASEADPRTEAFAREQAALAVAPPPSGVIELGARLPDAELLGPDGSARRLAGELGAGVAVLVLYRGAWCPFCNIALRTYQRELLPALRERGVALLAISPQKPDGSLSMKEKHELEFAVLSDPGNVVARAAGVLTGPTDATLAAQVGLGLDLASVNADGTPTLPMPTVAILDPDLTVRWIDVHPDYTTRTEPAAVLAALGDV